MNCFFLKFTGPQMTVARYQKLLRIVMHEQYRTEIVRDYMIRWYILQGERNVRHILDRLYSEGLIEPVDGDVVAKQVNATFYYWCCAFCMDIEENQEFFRGHAMADMLRIVFETHVKFLRP